MSSLTTNLIVGLEEVIHPSLAWMEILLMEEEDFHLSSDLWSKGENVYAKGMA